jgi:hypothetical protein
VDFQPITDPAIGQAEESVPRVRTPGTPGVRNEWHFLWTQVVV